MGAPLPASHRCPAPESEGRLGPSEMRFAPPAYHAPSETHTLAKFGKTLSKVSPFSEATNRLGGNSMDGKDLLQSSHACSGDFGTSRPMSNDGYKTWLLRGFLIEIVPLICRRVSALEGAPKCPKRPRKCPENRILEAKSRVLLCR
jgi:hypothetical protein